MEMTDLLKYGLLVSVIFLFIDLIFDKVKNKKINLKNSLKNALIVLVSGVLAIYIIDNFSEKSSKPDIFIGEPSF